MLRLYNTLSRTIEDFKPLNPQHVTMYSCGPTVYDYQHIGHMRRYVGDDILLRILKLNGYQINRVMNITDVGHLVSDADEGEDKMEKGARKFSKSVWEIAKLFEKQFIESCEALLIETPTKLMHATDYIKEQIGLIKVLEEKGFTYRITDGIYFDTSKFPDYTKLSHQKEEELKAGARVEMTEGKKHATDFALWKFSYPDGRSFDSAQAQRDDASQKRQMEWESPWGVGFPGWHIECSAMSLEGLFHCFTQGTLNPQKVQTIDIHTGGIDHIAIHHTNEIAQSEAAISLPAGKAGKQFVKYWVHHNFLQVEGEKMSKSLGNMYTVQDVIDKGFDPMSLRYLYLQTHYRQEMNFTWESLEAAETALRRLRSEISNFSKNVIANPLSGVKQSRGVVEKTTGLPRHFVPRNDIEEKFTVAINDDMNTAKALAVVWELVKSDISHEEKIKNLIAMDNVLGLELFKKEVIEIPEKIAKIVKEREQARKEKNFQKSDELRDEIRKLGYEVKDTPKGQEVSIAKR